MFGNRRSTGVILIIVGIIHLGARGVLDPTWGVIIIAIGLVNFFVEHPGVFILNGCALVLVGLINRSAGGGWTLFGILGIFWGVQEFWRYRTYRRA
jgi:hypothetical protein